MCPNFLSEISVSSSYVEKARAHSERARTMIVGSHVYGTNAVYINFVECAQRIREQC